MQSASRFNPISTPPLIRTKGWSGQWVGACGLLILLGFSWIPNSYTRMVSWPYALIWQGGFCLWLGWGLWMSRQFDLPFRRLGYGLDWIVLLAITSCALSTLAAQFRAIAYWNFLLFFNYIIVLYVVVNWLRIYPPLQNKLWLSIILSGALTHLISLFSWRPSAQMWSAGDFNSAIRNPFPLGHHNFVGGYCLLMLPLTVGLIYMQRNQQHDNQQHNKWYRIGYVAIALNLFILYTSGSRGALLGAIALAIVALVFYYLYQKPKKLSHWLLSILCLLIVAGALLSNPRVRSLTTINPSATSSISIQQIGDGPVKDRLFMLQAGQRIFKDHPLSGVGPGNLSRIYNRYRPIETGSGLELVQQLHNTPAQILAELGLLGLASYGLTLTWLLKVGIGLLRKIKPSPDRVLLYSIMASWFAYTVSSLTDYQLENIGISSILLLTVALLIVLADKYLDRPMPPAFNCQTRRSISLGLLFAASLSLQSWVQADAAFYLHHSAKTSTNNFDYVAADTKWMKASKLMPEDPTYAALSSEQLTAIEKNITDEKNQLKLREAAITSLRAALKAAPNDPWLHQNLAVLLLNADPKQSEQHLRKTILLYPRSSHHTYYTLGRSYLSQNKLAEAIVAFSLEGLINPKFLSSPIWETDPYISILPAVLDKTLTAQKSVLSNTTSNSSQYVWLQRQLLFTRWWHQKPFAIPKGISPIETAILTIEAEPQKAVHSLRQIAKVGSGRTAAKALLLLSWYFPKETFPPFLHRFQITHQEAKILSESSATHQNFRAWLNSITYPIPEKLRYGLSFAYRNAAANQINQILSADDLRYPALTKYLDLFSNPPREFPQLDREIIEIAQQELHFSFTHQS